MRRILKYQIPINETRQFIKTNKGSNLLSVIYKDEIIYAYFLVPDVDEYEFHTFYILATGQPLYGEDDFILDRCQFITSVVYKNDYVWHIYYEPKELK